MAFDWTDYIKQMPNMSYSESSMYQPEEAQWKHEVPLSFYLTPQETPNTSGGEGMITMGWTPNKPPPGLTLQDVLSRVMQDRGPSGVYPLANAGYFDQFPEFTPQARGELGQWIVDRQSEVENSSEFMGINGLDTNFVQLASVLAGPALGMAGAYGSGTGGATGASTAGGLEGMSAGAGDAFTGGFTGTATGAPGLSTAGFDAGAMGAGGTSASPGLVGVGGGSMAPGFFAGETLGAGTGAPGGQPPYRATSPVSNGWNTKDMAQVGLGGAGALYNLYTADKANDATRAALDAAANATAQQQYPHQQNWDWVNKYLNDPMSVLKNNPGYEASKEYLTKAGLRQMAGTGYNNSGNSNYYLADVLGKNAQKWYSDAWQPIRDAAGVQNFPNMAQLAGAQTQGQQNIATNQRNSVGDIVNVGSKAIPGIMDYFGVKP